MSKIYVDEIAPKTAGGIVTVSSTLKTDNPVLQLSALNYDQAYSTGQLKIEWPTVDLDTHSYWNSSLHRYQPQIAGWYYFSINLRFVVGGNPSYYRITIRKNGLEGAETLVLQPQFTTGVISNGAWPGPAGMIHLNGTTDFVDTYMEANNTLTIHDSTSQSSYFSAFLARKD